MKIDWKRVAKPQPDGYDSHVIATLLHEQYGWKKIQPTTDLRLCNGAVAVCEDKQYSPEQLDNPLNPMINGMEYMTPEICAGIDRFLMAWPEGGQMLSLFLEAPLLSTAHQMLTSSSSSSSDTGVGRFAVGKCNLIFVSILPSLIDSASGLK